MQQSPRRHPRLAGPSAMRADESVRPAQTSDILAASSVAAEPLVNFLKGPWVINPRDKVTGVLHPPRLPSGPTGVKRIPYQQYMPDRATGRLSEVGNITRSTGTWPDATLLRHGLQAIVF